MKEPKYPRFFEIDETIIRLDKKGDEVKGVVVKTGLPYSPAKALVDGREITKKQHRLQLRPFTLLEQLAWCVAGVSGFWLAGILVYGGPAVPGYVKWAIGLFLASVLYLVDWEKLRD